MGEIHLFTKEQEIILDEVKQDNYLCSRFYFTGGTALSSVYLQHRYSDDLDFFSEKKIDQQLILSFVEEWSQKYNFTFKSRFIEVVYRFSLFFLDKPELKIDFAYYPPKRIKPPIYRDNLAVDSLTDIAINKLFVIAQRTEVKDFIDLYFLLPQFSLWDLIHGVKVKFRAEIDPFLLASDFLKVETFNDLPKMIKPLSLKELKKYFRERAEELGKQSVE